MAQTPNMNLQLPTVTVTTGPQWAALLNAALSQIDNHDHTTGKGVKVTPLGLNINSDLDINNFNLNAVNSVRVSDNISPLASSQDIRSVYVVNGDLFYNNSAGTAVQITAGGAVNTGGADTPRYPTHTVTTNLNISAAATYILLLVNTSSTRTIVLPPANGVDDGRFFIIKDVTGLSSTNPILISPFGADTIDSTNAGVFLDNNFGAWSLASNGLDSWYFV